MGLRTIIVDDELDGTEVLKILLAKSKFEIDLVGVATNLKDAIKLINEEQPQLVFLDVEMPGERGYEIVNHLEEINFSIVFVTAYDEYAMKAFEVNAVDYLLKPINRMRLQEAIERVSKIELEKENKNKYLELINSLKPNKQAKVILNEVGKKRVVNLEDIIAIQAQGPYSKVYLLGGDVIMISKNLGSFEDEFPEKHTFFRSHKSWLINTNCIDFYQKSKGEILMANNLLAKLSKYKKAEFEKSLL